MKKMIKTVFVCLLAILMALSMLACAAPAAPAAESAPAQAPQADVASAPAPASDFSDQLYIFVTTSMGEALFINHDIRMFEEWGKQMGVQTQVVGTTEYDEVKLVDILEQAAAQNPAGILVNGVSEVLSDTVNKIVDSGVNLILTGSDFECNRSGWVGSDWETIGTFEAQVVAEKMGGKGKVAYMGSVGKPNQETAFDAFENYLSRYPDIEIVGCYDAAGSAEKAAENVHNIYNAHPDIDAICAFEYPDGLGIGPALKELGIAGDVIVVTTDWEKPQLDFVKDGTYTALIGQKRECFTYYAAMQLFIAHNSLVTWGTDGVQLNPIAHKIDTGVLIIDENNIDQFYGDSAS